MRNYKYLIVGGGLAGDAAAAGLSAADPGALIALLCEESDPPYNRPPLSKMLWKGLPIDAVWRGTSRSAVDVLTGRTVTRLDPATKMVEDAQGETYSFEKCLLATGGRPRRLASDNEDVIYYRTLADYRRLRELCDQSDAVTVLGGGFIGMEIAACLRETGKAVTMIFPEKGIGARLFPPRLVEHLNEVFQAKGIRVRPGRSVIAVSGEPPDMALELDNGERLSAPVVVAGLGMIPNVELAREAGLTVDRGIKVNAELQTSHPDVYAAGDVAEFFSPALEEWLLVEHEDNAYTMGELAAKNMAGAREVYDHLPSFYSSFFDINYEAVGILDTSLPMEAKWYDGCAEASVAYLEGDRVKGVLLWNIGGALQDAREMIDLREPLVQEKLAGLRRP